MNSQKIKDFVTNVILSTKTTREKQQVICDYLRNEISYYDWMAFEGKLLKSNSVHIQYYCDKDGYPISMKQIFFKKYDEGCDCGIQVGTMIKYRRDGTIKSIDHIK